MVALFQLNRIVFILFNLRFAVGCSAAELFEACIHGLSLDFTTAGYVTVLPMLVTIITLWTPATKNSLRIWRYILLAYFAVVLTLIGIIHTGDIGMFEAWQSRIDAQVLIYTPSEMMASVTWGMAIAGILYVVATVLPTLWLVRYVIRRWFDTDYDGNRYLRIKIVYSRMIATAVMLILSGCLFVVIRGGLTPAAANVSKAYFSPKMFLNQAAINPVFSFMSSYIMGANFDEYNFYDEEQAKEIFDEVMRDGDAEMARWLKCDTPNVIIILAEGMGRTITDTSEGKEETTPNLNRLKTEGIWFENLYASSFRTDRGTVAVLSGFPAQPKMSIMEYPNKAAKLPAIARTLRNAGYSTRFIYGGDANFTNTKAYLYATGYNDIVDENSGKFSGHTSKWGYADNTVLNYAANAILDRMAHGGKCHEVILTLSSHEPFDVPYRRLKSDLLNSFAFADDCIGTFVERIRQSPYWDDTLIIIVPDHGYPYPASVGNNSPERHHIPMLWVGGAVAEPMVIEEHISQTDIAATLLSQIGLPHDDFAFSRNISSPDTSRFGYWTYNNGFGVIDSLGVTIYDCNMESALRSENDPELLRERRGKAMLQMTFHAIKHL
ncbi:MAG: sulfatase-like hydrolase/transferase [Alistipes sp.]|nr:sulfatase-like hydrolase/transferase [Alistipes sp.]